MPSAEPTATASGPAGPQAHEVRDDPGDPPGLSAHPPGPDEVVRDDDRVGPGRHEAEVGAEDVGDDGPLAGAVAREVLTDGDRVGLDDGVGAQRAGVGRGSAVGVVVVRADRLEVVDVDALGLAPPRCPPRSAPARRPRGGGRSVAPAGRR